MKTPHHRVSTTIRVYSIGVEFSSRKDRGQHGRINNVEDGQAGWNTPVIRADRLQLPSC